MQIHRLLAPLVIALAATACGSAADGGASGMQTPGGMMMSPTQSMSDAHGGMMGGTADLTDCRTVEEGQVEIEAEGLEYDTGCIQAPAGEAFTITLNNRDGAPHNITIEDSAGNEVFSGENVTQGSIDYAIPALDAGQYPFHCHVHPDMTGVLVVE